MFTAGIVPKELYSQLAGLGIFGISVDEEYGGAGLATHKFHAIQSEEASRAGVSFGVYGGISEVMKTIIAKDMGL